MSKDVYRQPLPRAKNDLALRLCLQSQEPRHKTHNVPGVIAPHVVQLMTGQVEGVAVLTRVPAKLHQLIAEAVYQAVKDFHAREKVETGL